MKNLLDNQIVPREQNTAPEQSLEKFQIDWEELILKSIQSGKEEVKDIRTIELLNGESFEEKLYVHATPLGISVGAILKNKEKTLLYTCGFSKPYSEKDEKDYLIAQPRISINASDKAASLPPRIVGGLTMEISAKYDKYIVQAVANTQNKKIKHLIDVGDEYESERERYLNDGYQAMKGYPNKLDKMFYPAQKN